MKEQTDKIFIKNFSWILIAMVLFTVTIIFLARSVGFKEHVDAPSRSPLTEERIKPVAGVYTSEADVTAIPEAVPESASEQTFAFDGSLDGEMIYGSVCSACHATAVLGAPQPGSEQMSQRAENGMDAMMVNVLNGLNAMPARGGRPDLSDEQVKAVIDFMLK